MCKPADMWPTTSLNARIWWLMAVLSCSVSRIIRRMWREKCSVRNYGPCCEELLGIEMNVFINITWKWMVTFTPAPGALPSVLMGWGRVGPWGDLYVNRKIRAAAKNVNPIIKSVSWSPLWQSSFGCHFIRFKQKCFMGIFCPFSLPLS
jgi:hypothetical protein